MPDLRKFPPIDIINVKKHGFHSSNSSTCIRTDEFMEIHYGTGAAKGRFYIDTVTIADNLNVHNQTFALVKNCNPMGPPFLIGKVSRFEQSNNISLYTSKSDEAVTKFVFFDQILCYSIV